MTNSWTTPRYKNKTLKGLDKMKVLNEKKKQDKMEVIKSIIKSYIVSYEIKCNPEFEIDEVIKQIAIEILLETLR